MNKAAISPQPKVEAAAVGGSFYSSQVAGPNLIGDWWSSLRKKATPRLFENGCSEALPWTPEGMKEQVAGVLDGDHRHVDNKFNGQQDAPPGRIRGDR